MITNKILILFLLCTALPTFCMNGPQEPGRWRLVVEDRQDRERLDDGHIWTSIKKVEDVAPFLGKLVAYRSQRVSAAVDMSLYKIRQNDPTRLAFICHVDSPPNAYQIILSASNGGVESAGLITRHSITILPFRRAMRLLTYNEACCEELHKYHRVPLVWRLNNLIPEERINYFRAKEQKDKWQRWERLLWIGQRDSGSSLHGLPRDVVRLFARYTLNAQAEELQGRAKPDDELDLKVLSPNNSGDDQQHRSPCGFQ